jgi:hypothetical protein
MIEQESGSLDRTEGDRMIVNMGPSHPVTHGTLHLVLELEGEIIVKATPHIGYLHRGVEKLGESLTYQQFIPLTDRLNYCSSLMNNVGYTLAVEKLLGIQDPPRSQVIRVLCSELARIGDHLVCIGTNAVDIGAFSAFLYLFKERETIYDLFEMLAGQRLHASFTRIGGLFRDAPPEFAPLCEQFLDSWLPRLPGSRREIELCAAAWDAPRPVLLDGRDASRSRVRSALAARPAVVHFATHVLGSADRSRYGLIALSLGEGGRLEILEPREIAAWQLPPALVVLSGCGSGAAEAPRGSGLMGLTRAWLAGGAAGVVATYWPTPDDNGALLAGFYRHLRDAAPPAVALQRAQLEMLRSGDWRSPARYWSAYFLAGTD